VRTRIDVQTRARDDSGVHTTTRVGAIIAKENCFGKIRAPQVIFVIPHELR
jgi:hypothetical protein